MQSELIVVNDSGKQAGNGILAKGWSDIRRQTLWCLCPQLRSTGKKVPCVGGREVSLCFRPVNGTINTEDPHKFIYDLEGTHLQFVCLIACPLHSAADGGVRHTISFLDHCIKFLS